jgi:hypothetical protein
MSTADTALVAAVTAALEEGIPTLAVRIAQILVSDHASTIEQSGSHERDNTVEIQLRDLLDQHRHRRSGDAERWIEQVSNIAGDDTVPALRWAWEADCPTRWWINQHALPTAPIARGRRTATRSELDHLVAEYACARTNRGRRMVAALDDTVDTLRDLISAHTAADSPSINHTWRRNTLALLTHAHGDHEVVIAVIRWCLQHRPHWQRTTRKPPTVTTFTKMRGDYRVDGQEWSLDDIPAATAASVIELANGWQHYMQSTTGVERPISAKTLHNLHATMTGSQTAPAVPVADIQQLIRWLLKDGNIRFLPFHLRDADFPDQDTVQRVLLAMRTSSTGAMKAAAGVAATNDAASGRGVSELTELRGLA